MQNFLERCFLIGVCVAPIFFVGCKTRNENTAIKAEENFDPQESVKIRNTVTPQYVVRPRMIFKFYCTATEKIPDCKEYDVMRVGSFLRAAGVSEKEIAEYEEYLQIKKSGDQSKKKLEELEAAYKAAIEKKGKVLPDQEREYKRMKKIYEGEVKKFESFDPKIVAKAKNTLAVPSELDKYFDAEVGEIAAGGSHTCALKLSGEIICWGYDEFRQVSGWKEKVLIGELKLPIKMVSAGESHNCAIGADGGVSCWGKNDDEQVTGWKKKVTGEELKIPIKAVSAGGRQSCAIGADGGVSCWGFDGDGRVDGWKSKVKNGELRLPTKQIATRDYHSCAIGADGGVSYWESKYTDPIGSKEVVMSGELKLPAKQISVANGHSCAIGANGGVSCWGGNANGRVDGWKAKVNNGEFKLPAKKIATGGYHSCAIGADGEVSCWGNDGYGRVDGWKAKVNNGELNLPAKQIDAGMSHSCAIGSDRKLVCWGDNEYGRVNGRNEAGYKIGEFVPEDFASDLTKLGYYEE